LKREEIKLSKYTMSQLFPEILFLGNVIFNENDYEQSFSPEYDPVNYVVYLLGFETELLKKSVTSR